jgi:hypothetical protein
VRSTFLYISSGVIIPDPFQLQGRLDQAWDDNLSLLNLTPWIITFNSNNREEGKDMIKDDRNYHQRLQEFCDCYLETDPKKELEKAAQGMSGDPSGDFDELALKFLGLGIFYGATEKAKKISFDRSEDGKVLFSVESRGKYQLPPPSVQVVDRIISIGRSITHIDEAKGKEPVSFGLRNDRLDLTFQFDRKKAGETFSILFPKL